ncbi:MAG: N-acetylmuramoyl-L-alanine amidase [Actinomycetota bacterium]|nr:N-acetylmuramoyl-L-alanine amidase [Actinomycetota bacterium]
MAFPPVSTRAAWGARPPRATQPLRLPVSEVVLHHTAGGTSSETRQVRAAQDEHMDVRGWDDIAYNWLVGQSGRVFDGRIRNMGAATKGRNDRSVAICLIGDFDRNRPSAAAISSVSELYARLIVRRIVTSRATLIAHRDVADTVCPGRFAVGLIDHMRREAHVIAFPGLPRYPGGLLRVGSANRSATRRVQRALTAIGFRPGPADGIYGRLTATAVRSFQARARLGADGVVGPSTWAALSRAVALRSSPV